MAQKESDHRRNAMQGRSLLCQQYPAVGEDGRIAFLKEMIADMYEQGLLVREDGSYRYFVR